MPVFLAVLAAGDVDPVVVAVGGLQDELVEVGVLLEVGEPTVGSLHIGVVFAVSPRGVVGFGQGNVGGFAQGVLAGIDASYLYIEAWAAVAGTDDDRLSGERSEGFEDGATELLQGGDVLCGDGVVYAVGVGH